MMTSCLLSIFKDRPITSGVPKKRLAIFSEMTILLSWEKAAAWWPRTKGRVNMLNREESTYWPFSYMVFSPRPNKVDCLHEERHAFFTPGSSVIMAGPSKPGVAEKV